MQLDAFKTLGRSGLKVSPLCLGGMTLGDDWNWGADAATAAQLIQQYTDLGGNFIDTANIYTNGHSEKIIGDTIGRYSSKRNRTVIGTKCSANTLPGNPNAGGGSTQSILYNVHESLRRLQTDYIDLLWIHQWDWNTPFEETMRALHHLVTSGKVRYIGVSYAPAWKIAQAQTTALLKDWTPFIGLQIEYSLLERSIEDELIPMAAELGLGITPWSPLKGGILSGKYQPGNQTGDSRMGNAYQLSEKELNVVEKVKEIAQRHNATPAAIALAWVLQKQSTTSIILGVRTPAQLAQNIAALEVTLTQQEMNELDTISTPPPTFVTNYKEYSRSFVHGGIEINGLKAAPLPAFQQMTPGKY
ncbi:aldo/keto reductase [Chitinophaga sp.]|uniref:aldo/keto reductase n=1 Tax=Chitinophaga sp. TaxID=1869181 RepID=UPI0031D9A2BD